MTIASRQELEVTRGKLTLLEERLEALKQESAQNQRARDWSICSLKQTINEMKEEIARFKSRAPGAASNP